MNAVETIAQKTTEFSSTNTSIANYKILDAGVDDALIIKPVTPFNNGPVQTGSFNSPFGKYSSERAYTLEVYRRYEYDGVTLLSLSDTVDSLIDEFNKYPTLDGASSVVISYIETAGDVFEILRDGEGPYFLMQPLTLHVEFEITRTSSE
jgi:hypothetical protein